MHIPYLYHQQVTVVEPLCWKVSQKCDNIDKMLQTICRIITRPSIALLFNGFVKSIKQKTSGDQKDPRLSR